MSLSVELKCARGRDVSFELKKQKKTEEMLLTSWYACKRPANRVCKSTLTFIGHLEAQGATGIIRFEIEPHLVTGADHQVWGGGTRQARGHRKEDRSL